MGNNLTLDEVSRSETAPDKTPKTYSELVDYLRIYYRFLVVLFGFNCDHAAAVHALVRKLQGMKAHFYALAPNKVAGLYWAVFLDARGFFSATIGRDGSLPVSSLQNCIARLYSGEISIPVSTPLAEMAGAGASLPSAAGGSEGASWSAASSAAAPTGGRSSDLPAGKRICANVPGPVRSALSGARTKYPSIRVVDLMTAATPPKQIMSMQDPFWPNLIVLY